MAWSGSPTVTRFPPPPASRSSSSTWAGAADGEGVPAAAGQQVEQLDLGGVGVLVLVDEQPAGPLPLLAQQVGVVAQLADRGPDQLGRVVPAALPADGGGERGDAGVLLGEAGSGLPVRQPA